MLRTKTYVHFEKKKNQQEFLFSVVSLSLVLVLLKTSLDCGYKRFMKRLQLLSFPAPLYSAECHSVFSKSQSSKTCGRAQIVLI